MAYTETSSEGWFSRIGGAIKGVLFGLVLFVLSFAVLGYNEYNFVQVYKSLKEAQGVTISVEADSVEAANEGALIHLSGKATTSDTLTDPGFSVSQVAIKLSRKVEMYQWKETEKTEKKKELGGSEKTVKTYTYSKEWSNSEISSAKFADPEAPDNPTVWAYQAKSWTADNVSLGAFRLSPALIGDIDKPQPISLTDVSLPAGVTNASIQSGQVYIGTPAVPAIGDLRITLSMTPPLDVTVISQQKGQSFTPFVAKTGKTINMLRDTGLHSMDEMYNMAHGDNEMMNWILRAVGFFMMFFGMSLMLKPLAILADVVPFFGNLVGAGVGIICFLSAIVMTFLTIAIAWIVVRPLVGIPLLVVSLGAGILVGKKLKNAKADAVTDA